MATYSLQAFSLPGSMYLSILGGAVWGIPRALPLACTCVATGGTLCYLISAALGPALLTMPKWKAKFDVWAEKIQSQKDNIISFLIVLRIAPFPPHWVVNVLCPHLGIGIVPFWISTWLGIFGVSVIHTTIGNSLDNMTSAADFHLISWKNFFLLSAVVVGVMIPVGLRYVFKRELASVAATEAAADDANAMENGEATSTSGDTNSDLILAEGPPAVDGDVGKAKAVATTRLIMLDEDDDDYSDESDDEDIIPEAGPALVVKPKDGEPSTSSVPSSSSSPTERQPPSQQDHLS